MTTMIPASISQDAPFSEQKVFEHLRRAPKSDDWFALHSLALSSAYTGQYGEIDFLVIIPHVGMICIEVKGGGVSYDDAGWITINAAKVKSRLRRSPFQQAKEGIFKLETALEDRLGRNSSEARCPIGWMVIFPDCICPPVSAEFTRDEVIDQTELGHAIGVKLRKAPSLSAKRGSKVAPTDGTCRNLLTFLRPVFEHPPTEASRVWDAERKILALSTEQFEFFKGLLGNERMLVHGAAGTGKTILAVETARHFVETGLTVLLTCFNRKLGSSLKDISGAFGKESITAGNLHRILYDDILRTSYADKFAESGRPDSGADFFNLAALSELELGRIFDVVIIDEIQDFDPEQIADLIGAWTSTNPQMRLFIFGDLSRQALYDASARSIDHIRKHLGALGLSELTVNRRNTQRIARFSAKITGRTGAMLSDRAPEGDPVMRTYFVDIADELAKLNGRLQDLRAAGYVAKDIVILGPRKFENSCLSGLKKLGSFEIGPDDLVGPKGIGYSTIHSFKGLEKNVVLLVDIGFDGAEQSDALLYVGITRAKIRLFVFIAASAREALERREAEHLQATFSNGA